MIRYCLLLISYTFVSLCPYFIPLQVHFLPYSIHLSFVLFLLNSFPRISSIISRCSFVSPAPFNLHLSLSFSPLLGRITFFSFSPFVSSGSFSLHPLLRKKNPSNDYAVSKEINSHYSSKSQMRVY
jgi:hypothetical protein